MATVPKLRVPFAVTGSRAETVEQDSNAEIAQCVYAILATPVGTRVEEPDFGFEDQAFRKGGADLDELRAAVERWEPRAEILTEFEFADVVEKVRVHHVGT